MFAVGTSRLCLVGFPIICRELDSMLFDLYGRDMTVLKFGCYPKWVGRGGGGGGGAAWRFFFFFGRRGLFFFFTPSCLIPLDVHFN